MNDSVFSTTSYAVLNLRDRGEPTDNAVAERIKRINGILKNEYLAHYKVKTLKDAKTFLHQVVKLYNNDRPHMSIGLLTPALVHESNIQTEKVWKNYYTKNVSLHL